MAKSDFLDRYHGSALGLLWALVNPAFQLVIYYIVFAFIFESETQHFILFLFLGLIILLFFTEATNKGLELFNQKRYILENIRINRIDLFYAALLSTFLGFVFNFAVFFVISLFFNTAISWEAVFLPLILINLVVFILGVMVVLSVIFVHLQDIYHLWNLLSMVLLWLSGVFFEIEPNSNWGHQVLYHLSPLPGIIFNMRNVLIYGLPMDWQIFWYDSLYAFAFLGMGLWVMKKFGSRAVEKL